MRLWVCTFKERSLTEKTGLSAPHSPTRELAERKQTSEQKPSRPMGLLFSLECPKPGGSFNTPEIVPGMLSAPWGCGCQGEVCALLRPEPAGGLGCGEPRRGSASPG